MSRLMIRAAILAQGAGAGPPPPGDPGTPWELDPTRTPAGYTLADGNRSAINTSGGSDYRRWVPTALPLQPWHGRRYWEVLCAASGAAAFDGFMGVVSDALREDHDAGINPITRGSIGWRGDGTLWSSDTTTAIQRLTGLPGFGAGDVLMFVLDPASASLWIGRNGTWRDDPATDPPTWAAAGSTGFHPQVHGRNPGDGGTLRSLSAAFSHPVPPGVLPLAHREPDLSIRAAGGWTEHGGGAALTLAQAALYIERETP